MATPAVVQYPSGHVVAFPAGMSDDELHSAASKVWDQLQSAGETLYREGKAAGESIANLPFAAYHAAADPETEEEAQKYGKGFESKIGPTGRLIDRMVVQPTANAIEDYASGRVTPEAALSVAPEAIGGAAGSVVLAKAISAANKPSGGVTMSEPAPAPTPAEPMTETQRTAEAYLRRTKAAAPEVSPIGRESEGVAERFDKQPEAPATDEDINAFLKKHFGDSVPRVQIVEGTPAKPATTAEVNEAANQAVDEIRSKPGYKPDYTLGKARATGNGNIEHPILKDGKPIGIVNATIDSGGRATINWVGDENMNPDGNLSNKLGLNGVKSIKAAFEEAHPEVKEVTGTRIGGARGNALRKPVVSVTKDSALSRALSQNK